MLTLFRNSKGKPDPVVEDGFPSFISGPLHVDINVQEPSSRRTKHYTLRIDDRANAERLSRALNHYLSYGDHNAETD